MEIFFIGCHNKRTYTYLIIVIENNLMIVANDSTKDLILFKSFF